MILFSSTSSVYLSDDYNNDNHFYLFICFYSFDFFFSDNLLDNGWISSSSIYIAHFWGDVISDVYGAYVGSSHIRSYSSRCVPPIMLRVTWPSSIFLGQTICGWDPPGAKRTKAPNLWFMNLSPFRVINGKSSLWVRLRLLTSVNNVPTLRPHYFGSPTTYP